MIVIRGPILGKTKNRGGKDEADNDADDVAEERYEKLVNWGWFFVKFATWSFICTPRRARIMARNIQGHNSMTRVPARKHTSLALMRIIEVTPRVSGTPSVSGTNQ